MTVYVKKTSRPIESSVNLYTAALGFYLRGEEVIWYSDQQEIEELKADDVVVDYVRETQALLNEMGIQPPHFDYPTALIEYFGRGIRRGKIGEVVNHPEIWPVFIKSVDAQKSFTGRVGVPLKI